MGWRIRRKFLAKGLDELENALLEYYGAKNEQKMLCESSPQLAGTMKPPKMPEALVLYEKCEALGLPLMAGGAIDQPYIWLEVVAVVRKIRKIFEH